ncbi:MAG TPA: hypothetical protein VGF22_11440 [Acidimicrobiales bacterium]
MDEPAVASLGESRWPPAVAVLIFVALNISLRVWLPSDRTISVPWLLPAAEVGLLVVLVLADPTSDRQRAQQLRRVAIVLVFLLLGAALWATVVLVDHLVAGDKQTSDGARLLASGSLVWLGNVLAFSLLYWIFDSGGPRVRTHSPRQYPNFAFVQRQDPDLAPPGWHPVFVDYLYLGFCTNTAFSPTDVMPLARWTKLAMAVQSAVSLAVIGLVIARAVNVFS